MIMLFYFNDFNCAMIPEKRKQKKTKEKKKKKKKKKKQGAIGVGSLSSYLRLYFSL